MNVWVLKKGHICNTSVVFDKIDVKKPKTMLFQQEVFPNYKLL